jgi:cytochrome c556
MRKIPLILIALALLLGSTTIHGHAADSKKEVEALMKKKLTESQKLLAGIAMGDFDSVAKHAEALLEVSKKAEWKVLATPLYVIYSNQFQNNVEEMIKSAKKRNIDSTALSYVEVTLTCVKCHKHVREKRMARLDR